MAAVGQPKSPSVTGTLARHPPCRIFASLALVWTLRIATHIIYSGSVKVVHAHDQSGSFPGCWPLAGARSGRGREPAAWAATGRRCSPWPWFRDKGDIPRLGAGFGLPQSTAYRYLDEVIEVLAARVPGLQEQLGAVAMLTGPLFSGAPRPSRPASYGSWAHDRAGARSGQLPTQR